MKTEVSAVFAREGSEPIPGYTLEERIGIGGYGEVWRANAPGELKKAIKIVHGPMSDARIERELRAMERIRSVHHPMLLSVERFEIVNDHLVVVMELADGSLKDRFDETLAGACGLPREELLGHIRDAADALDYLYEKHQLQHLDVKPENLLIVGGRVKVADFGLIKDLADRSMSLVGGLTPVYAPPEVFDGKPCRHSDQYSLAIVYQEMLTGEPPFTGRTAAQLASQHLHCAPNLAGLPAHDRGVVTRALAKDPQRRFASCRSFVQELTKAPESFASERLQRSSAPGQRKTPPVRGKHNPSTRVRPITPAGGNMNTVRLSQAVSSGDVYPDSTEVRDLPPIEVTDTTNARPTLIIGLGETGMRALRHWRRRFTDQWQMLEQSPAFRTLLLDVDQETIRNASRGDESSALTPGECMALPLREAGDYRQRSELLLEWLNRRWLYNIPRSRKTEGIRPLGRLALIDHFEKVADRLRREISELMTPQAVQTTSDVLDSELETSAPRIVLVGSAAGGIAGGAMFDLGYAVRDALADMGLSDDHVLGILAHSTPRRTDGREIAVANTLSTLAELAYYSASEHGYPGEPACDIQPRIERRAPFAHTYVSFLGDQLDETGFDDGCRSLGEYLFQCTVSDACGALEQSRGPAYADSPFEEVSLNSFGVAFYAASDMSLVEQRAKLACTGLLKNWIGEELADQVSEMESAVQAIFSQLAISAEDIARIGEATVQSAFGEDPDACFLRIIAEQRAINGGDSERESTLTQTLANTIDQFTIGERTGNVAAGISLRKLAEKQMRNAAKEPNHRIDRWLVSLLDDTRFRLPSAKLAIKAIRQRLRAIRIELEASQENQGHKADSVRERFQAPRKRGASAATTDEAFLEYAQSRTKEAAIGAAMELVHRLIQANELRSQSVTELSRGFETLAENLNDSTSESDGSSDSHHETTSLRTLLVEEPWQKQLAHDLNLGMQSQFFDRKKPFSGFLQATAQDWAALRSTLWTAAERVAAAGLAQDRANGLLDEENADELEQQLERSCPRLLELGGARRLFIFAPTGTDAIKENWLRRIKSVAGQQPCFVACRDASLTLCGESAETTIRNFFTYLVGARPEFVKLAHRLHVRIDIDWPAVLE